MDENDKNICEAATQGTRWYWDADPCHKTINLVSEGFGKIVMTFDRYGMQSASPVFNDEPVSGTCILKRADEYFVIIPGREHHARWARDINHPDARFIAHFNPKKVMDLLNEIEELKKRVSELEKKE